MHCMFSKCIHLKFIDLSSLNSNNLINNFYMLVGCGNLEKVRTKKNFLSKDIESLSDINNNLKQNFCLINSIKYKFNSSENLFNYSKYIKRELNECIFDMGFQIFSLNDKTLYGGIEGPISSPYQNGFFLFKIVHPIDYPFKPPKFYFITKLFHPNIDEDGLVFADILENNWSPSLRTRTTIISVQSILGDPNFENFVNQNAASLYNLSKEVYNETVLEYVNNYANYSINKEKVKEFEVKDLIEYSN